MASLEEGSRLGCIDGFTDVGCCVGFWDGVKEAFELGAEDPDSEGDMLGSNDGLSDKEGFIEGSRLGSLDLDGDKLGTEDGSADTEGDELDSFVGLAVGGYVAAIGLVVGAAIGLVVGGADDSEGAPDSECDMLGSNDGLSDKEGFIEGSRLGSLDLDGDKLGTEDGSADTEGDELDSFVGLAVGGYVAAIGDNVGGGLGGAAIGDNVGGRLGGDGLGAGAATE
eukprot:scaffold3037_cov142-Skeletonema_marinoi.AAC.5